MSVKVNNELQVVIKNAINEAGSQSELSRRTGVSQANISKYIHGEIGNIKDETLLRLKPHLKSYESGNNKEYRKLLPQMIELLPDSIVFEMFDIAVTHLKNHPRGE